MLKKINHITLACVSLVALATAYGAVKVGVGLTHGNEPTPSKEDKTILALREWLVAIDVDKTEVSDISYWALVEIFLTLDSFGVSDRRFDRNAVSNPPLAGQVRPTVCANIALDEPHQSVVVSILNESPDLELRTEDQTGSRYGVLAHYEECDFRLRLEHTSLENYNGMVFDVMIGHNDFCAGWYVIYSRGMMLLHTSNLYRQRYLIC